MTRPDGAQADLVPSLVANAPHPGMEEYLKRPRGEWPPQQQLDEIKQLPMSFVLVGSKESENLDQQARNSWSSGEMLLISKLPNYIKQGFIAAKCTFKSTIKYYQTNETADGRSYVGSYHLKTTLLHHLEKTPPSQINSPFQFMIDVLHDLHMYLKMGTLPHYFLPKCNLLATVGHDERQIAYQTIHTILSDPVVSVLRCPLKWDELYGDDICPDDLVLAFCRVFARPSCERSRGDLLQLLSELDECRREFYDDQLDEDEDEDRRVFGRPELTGLVDMLEQIKHIWVFNHSSLIHISLFSFNASFGVTKPFWLWAWQHLGKSCCPMGNQNLSKVLHVMFSMMPSSFVHLRPWRRLMICWAEQNQPHEGHCYDDIPPKLLKMWAIKLASTITNLINLITDNHCLLNILPSVFKIFEKVFNPQLYECLKIFCRAYCSHCTRNMDTPMF